MSFFFFIILCKSVFPEASLQSESDIYYFRWRKILPKTKTILFRVVKQTKFVELGWDNSLEARLVEKEENLINTQIFPFKEMRNVAGMRMTSRFLKLLVSEPLFTVENQCNLQKGVCYVSCVNSNHICKLKLRLLRMFINSFKNNILNPLHVNINIVMKIIILSKTKSDFFLHFCQSC